MLSATTNRLNEKLMLKLTAHFGSEERVLQSLENGEVDKIAEVQGISSRRALQLARQFNGGEQSFLATKETIRLHDMLIKDLQSFCSTSSAKRKIQLFLPLTDQTQRLSASRDAMLLPSDVIRSVKEKLCNLRPLRTPTKRYERVVVTKEERPTLREKCRVFTPSADETWKDYTVFKHVTWIGEGAPVDLPEGWICVPEGADDVEVLPEYVIDWFEHNLNSIQSMLDIEQLAEFDDVNNQHIRRLRQLTPSAPSLRASLSKVSIINQEDVLEHLRDKLWGTAKDIEQTMHDAVSKGIQHQSVALQGEELLDALSNTSSLKRKLESATAEIIEEAVEHARQSFESFIAPSGLQCNGNLFSEGWPALLNKAELDLIHESLTTMIEANATDTIINVASALHPLIEDVETWYALCIETDVWLSIGAWAQHHGCTLPTFDNHGICVQQAFHPFIQGIPEPVDYGLGECARVDDQQNLALLTGANSGGKTTLLETLSFIVILAHMGLPVPATSAKVGRVESLHVLAKSGGTQSAGALEQTLEQLARVVSDQSPKFIFADELEAITEPGAGAKIIAGMLMAAERQENTTTVLVTHLAPAILEATGRDDLRVDGIEARGLDDRLELIVDRNPRRNYLAQSTPELILRRLHQRNEGKIETLFEQILSSFE